MARCLDILSPRLIKKTFQVQQTSHSRSRLNDERDEMSERLRHGLGICHQTNGSDSITTDNDEG